MTASLPRAGALFGGYGGLDLAVQSVLGASMAWCAEVDDAAARILAHHWPGAPNLGDVTQVAWHDAEPVEVLTGGFPCNDVSRVGRRLGLAPGTRSGLWEHMARAIDVLRPRLVVIENVKGLLSADAHSELEPCPWCLGDGTGITPLRALGAVLGDLADLRYDARWIGLRAADAGAPHERFRVFVAATDTDREPLRPEPRGLRGPQEGERRRGPANHDPARPGAALPGRGPAAAEVDFPWGEAAPRIERWARVTGRPAPAPLDSQGRLSPVFSEWMMGLPAGWVTDPAIGISTSAQHRALGNGVVPQQAALALTHLLADQAHDLAA